MSNLVLAISQGVPVRRADSPRARTGVLDCFKIHGDSFLQLFATHSSESIGCDVGNQNRSVQAKQLDVGIGDAFISAGATISSSAFVADHLRPAAKAAGVQIEDGQRFGFHNLRHSLSNWLVNKAKVEPKIVQSILRHSRIQTTLDLYTQEDSDETRAAQGEFLSAVGMSTEAAQ